MKHLSNIFIIISILIFAPITSIAGTGHDHGHAHEPISGPQAQSMALQRVQQLVSAGKVDSSWAAVKTSEIKQKDYGHGPEWVVIFKNDKVKDAAKQTLYLFFSLDGHYLAANYDGS